MEKRGFSAIRILLICVVILILTIVIVISYFVFSVDKDKQNLEKLTGVWILTSKEVNGEKITNSIFYGSEYTFNEVGGYKIPYSAQEEKIYFDEGIYHLKNNNLSIQQRLSSGELSEIIRNYEFSIEENTLTLISQTRNSKNEEVKEISTLEKVR